MISKNFARCLAKISGDGNLNRYCIRYSNSCDTLIEEFKQDMNYLFKNIKFYEGRKDSKTKYVQVYGKSKTEVFLRELSSFKSSDILVPESIKNSDDSVMAEYLRAFYDDEGCVAIRLHKKTNEWKRNITLTSNSLKILEEIKNILLSRFQIYSNKIIPTAKNRADDKTFVLAISGKGNISKFKDNIGFKHPKKIKKLELTMKSYYATFRNKVEFEKLKEELIRSRI